MCTRYAQYKEYVARENFGRGMRDDDYIDEDEVKFIPFCPRVMTATTTLYVDGYNRIPVILGLIDCFKVAFNRPIDNEEAFYSHNTGTSKLLQTPIILFDTSESVLVATQTNSYGATVILNDVWSGNGYTLSPLLLTSIVNAPEGSPEAQYTREHESTRCKIEQCFGILTKV
ncbi:hypothetical protein TSAR_007118 [Trichomalopsis sarcophagae]|uniref:DDE Tnp4 domain-containing protein n=1 Tax=Trichomalopsis sarcophagae TaxID=543379 RepID=A0A232ERJ4_9HYME|nr:hypothetical protein TSAR_007118 [Trichomalopsis sarcophagae]